MNTKTKKTNPSKKDLKAKLASQLHTALADFKAVVHDKKWQKLVKKSAKLFADAIHHHNKPAPAGVIKKVAVKKAAPKKAAEKKTALRPAVKKAAKKK